MLTVPLRPLDGITALAFKHAVAAPVCTRYLADQNAFVIKLEPPPLPACINSAYRARMDAVLALGEHTNVLLPDLEFASDDIAALHDDAAD